MNPTLKRAYLGVRRHWLQHRNNQEILKISRVVLRNSSVPDKGPVLMFNASTRVSGISLNAAYSLITSWALRLAGVRVIHAACHGGMKQCVLGTNREDLSAPPPCDACIYQSTAVYSSSQTTWLQHEQDEALDKRLEGLSVEALSQLVYKGLPLGSIVIPSIRWVLRRHNLDDNESVRSLYRNYILSAWSLHQQFAEIIKTEKPSAVIVFNGMFFPEAVVRQLCVENSIRCISHEVGLQPFSAFFTDGKATAYPIDIPAEFVMSDEQNRMLDDYLQSRLQGNFSMAGVKFWPEMRKLDESFWNKARKFKQIVPVFTNVIFDTSQGHANVVFSDMFEWLESVKQLIESHADTLFIIRAHPDETRPGKASKESVADWVRQSGTDRLNNVIFVPPDEYFSSYEIILNSKFVMVYNSTIGLEASLLGAAVLCGGKARFTQIPTVFFPKSQEEYRRLAVELLAADVVSVPPEYKQNARKFLFYQVFKTSIPFGEFISEDGIWPGYVRIKNLPLAAYKAENSLSIKVILDGILNNGSFLMDS